MIVLFLDSVLDIMFNENLKFNDYLTMLNTTFEELLINTKSSARFVLLKYYEEKNIDPLDNYILPNIINQN